MADAKGRTKKQKKPPRVIPGHQPYRRGDSRWRATVLSWPENGMQRKFYRERVHVYRKFKDDAFQVAYWAYVCTWATAYHFSGDCSSIIPAGQSGSEVHPRDGDLPSLKNQRVGVLHYADPIAKDVYALGYGETVGYSVPPAGIWGSVGSPHRAGVRSPEIKLDSGVTVWACEAWCLPEAGMKDFLNGLIRDGYDMLSASIDNYRQDGARKFEIQGDKGWDLSE